MAGTTVTTLAKKKMVKARAGISSLPKIVGMAFGWNSKITQRRSEHLTS
jgi:hypothetical protein